MSVSRVIRTRANLPVLLRRKTFPPAKPVIRYISKEGVAESGGSVIGPFNEGERLVLLCEVSGESNKVDTQSCGRLDAPSTS
ncbi:hypothetical protein MRX96_029466 [Rhipicephalus microplus]